jgi:hypothetical protein
MISGVAQTVFKKVASGLFDKSIVMYLSVYCIYRLRFLRVSIYQRLLPIASGSDGARRTWRPVRRRGSYRRRRRSASAGSEKAQSRNAVIAAGGTPAAASAVPQVDYFWTDATFHYCSFCHPVRGSPSAQKGTGRGGSGLRGRFSLRTSLEMRIAHLDKEHPQRGMTPNAATAVFNLRNFKEVPAHACVDLDSEDDVHRPPAPPPQSTPPPTQTALTEEGMMRIMRVMLAAQTPFALLTLFLLRLLLRCQCLTMKTRGWPACSAR